MPGHRKHIFIHLAAVVLFMSAKAQENYRVVNWNYQLGLYYGQTTAIIKDGNGFLWIGTANGLNRFDGNSFKNYSTNGGKNQNLLSNRIYSLVEDSAHNVWIGTAKGLSIYDCKGDSIRNFFPEQGTPYESTNIIPFWATAEKVFCMEADSLFTSYNIHSYEKKHWAALSKRIGDDPSLISLISLSVYEAKTNSVWLLPANGSLFAMSGLFQFSLSNGQLKHYDWLCFKHIPNHSHWTEGICYDRKRNSIWLNSEEGLIQFSLYDRQYHYVSALKDKHKRGVGIQMDMQDRVWVGTGNSDGLIVYDPQTGSISLPITKDSILRSKVKNYNYRIYCDRDSVVWVGYWSGAPGGVDQLIPMSKSVYQYPGDTHKPNSLSMNNGGAMATAGNKVWIFAWDGLNIFDPATESFRLVSGNNLTGNEKNKDIDFLTVSRTPQKGLLTMSKLGGLFEMDLTTNQCIPLAMKDAANHSIPHLHLSDDAFQFGDESIIFRSKNDSLIFILEKDSLTAHQLLELKSKHITNMASDKDHLLFIRFQEDALNQTYTYHDGNLIKMQTPLDSIAWNSIVFNKKDQSWWVSIYGSLLHFTGDFHLIQSYSRESGIPLINVWSIIPDDSGNIWFNTELSIAKLNTATEKITVLSEKDGWRPQGFKPGNITVKDANGDLYFYGYSSLDRVKPDLFVETYPASFVYLKSIEINQKEFALPTGANNLGELSLTFTQNRISVETGIIDYYSNGKSQIRYKLGDKGSWQNGPSNYSIYYEALPPGNYKLIMQASNATGDFIGPEKVLMLNIHPPWWQTSWAYALFALSFVFSLWAFIRYRSRSLKEKNIQLEEKVMHRTKELKHSLEDLKETQTQLIQREKMASLGELTAGIAHEIQNPLNFVNNFSEVNTELIAEMKEEIQKGNIEGVTTIATNIEENEQKISHHGKRADAIVKGMLQHARSSTGEKESTDINALTEEYLRLSYHGIKVKEKSFNATIHTDFDPGLSSFAKAPADDGKINLIPQEIGRVLLNLFNNAFYSVIEKKKKLGDIYEPVISVSTKRMEDAVEIRVRDNGIGISQTIIDKIYQPFFTTKPTGEGTGLGLSLSYDIITKMHGGDLKVETKEGEFAEFIIQLPIQ